MRNLSQVVLLLGIGVLLGWLLASDSCSWPPFRPSMEPEAAIGTESSASSQPTTSQQAEIALEEIQALLASEQYGEVSRVYDNIRLQDDELLGSRYKRIILDHAHDLVGAGRNQNAQALLSSILQTDYRDVDVLMVLAKSYREQDHEAQIQTLYDARANAYRNENLNAIEDRIRTAVADYTKQLVSQDDLLGLLQLYQMLTGIEPSHAPYFLELAEIQMKLDQYAEAAQSLDLIRYDPDMGSKAAQLLSEIERRGTAMGESATDTAGGVEDAIPLTRKGGHFLVNTFLNDAGPLNLLIDTGASVTVIKPGALSSLGIAASESNDWRTFNTANGRVNARMLTLRRLSLGNQVIEPANIAVMELDGSPDIDGLLGMNTLRYFRFYIDQENNTLLLSRE